MPARHVVVDGSNIATEGRVMPSLAQLEDAVTEYQKEFPDDELVIVVDATFGHRIDESERARFDDAIAHNEMVSPPAGAIGRGDAFLLRIADRVGGTVLSNDSFQEFHGEYEWLFNNGRLIGGKPVPGIGWIFTPRTPVRGPKSRIAVADAKKKSRRPTKASEQQQVREKEKVAKAISLATDEAEEPAASSKRRRRRGRGGTPPSEPVNEPLAFIQFVADHPLGSAVDGEVETFSSHGAFVRVDGARCYIPLSAMGSPPPRAAREVLTKGQTRSFVVQAIDTPRRGIELALPGFVHVAAAPTEETVEAEMKEAGEREAPAPRAKKAAGAKRPAKRSAPARPSEEGEAVAETPKPSKKTQAKRTARPAAAQPPRQAVPRRQPAPPPTQFAAEPVESTTEVAHATLLSGAVKKTAAKKTAAKKTAVTKTAAKKTAAKKTAAKKTAAKKTTAPAKKTPAKSTAPAKKTPAKSTAPAKKSAAKKSAASAKKAPAKAATKKAPAKKSSGR